FPPGARYFPGGGGFAGRGFPPRPAVGRGGGPAPGRAPARRVRSPKGARVMHRLFKLLGCAAVLAAAAGLALADDAPAKGKKGKKRRPPDPDAVFRKMDANGDGKVTREEFAKFHEEQRRRAEDRRFR